MLRQGKRVYKRESRAVYAVTVSPVLCNIVIVKRIGCHGRIAAESQNIAERTHKITVCVSFFTSYKGREIFIVPFRIAVKICVHSEVKQKAFGRIDAGRAVCQRNIVTKFLAVPRKFQPCLNTVDIKGQSVGFSDSLKRKSLFSLGGIKSGIKIFKERKILFHFSSLSIL